MTVAKGKRKFVAWIACCALLLASLAPSLAQTLERGGPGAWSEVCSVLGNKLVAADGSQDDSLPSAPTGHLFQHCPFCSLHVTALGTPPTPLSVPALVPLGFAVPELMLLAPRTQFAWATAQPRAPPLRA